MHLINQYRGLRKENYVLFFGRMVTNLGSMVWPVMTLILSQKMHFSATQSSLVILLAGVILVPVSLLGGRLADRYNKKHIIIYCDIVSVVFYTISAFVPLSYITIGTIITAAACQSMEHPAYNALIADITCTSDRERAYSLQYLGSNIGLVASPMIAGLLFKDYLWLSFLISGIAIGISTILIFLFVQNIEPEEDDEEKLSYQEGKEHLSLVEMLLENKLIFLYILIVGVYSAVYQQYGYLMPLDLGHIHGENGAIIYGSVSSLNCIVVVLCTPIFTMLFKKMVNTKKNFYGELFLLVGYIVFLLMRGKIPFYYIAIILFTFGEILTTIANGPYLTERIPESHRGRINGFLSVVQSVLQAIFLLVVGALYDWKGSCVAWIFVLGMLLVSIFGAFVLIGLDRRVYKELYLPRKRRKRKKVDKTENV